MYHWHFSIFHRHFSAAWWYKGLPIIHCTSIASVLWNRLYMPLDGFRGLSHAKYYTDIFLKQSLQIKISKCSNCSNTSGKYRTSIVQSDHDVIKDREKPLKTDSHLDTKIYLLLAWGFFLQIYLSNDIYSLAFIFNISQ